MIRTADQPREELAEHCGHTHLEEEAKVRLPKVFWTNKCDLSSAGWAHENRCISRAIISPKSIDNDLPQRISWPEKRQNSEQ